MLNQFAYSQWPTSKQTDGTVQITTAFYGLLQTSLANKVSLDDRGPNSLFKAGKQILRAEQYSIEFWDESCEKKEKERIKIWMIEEEGKKKQVEVGISLGKGRKFLVFIWCKLMGRWMKRKSGKDKGKSRRRKMKWETSK